MHFFQVYHSKVIAFQSVKALFVTYLEIINQIHLETIKNFESLSAGI